MVKNEGISWSASCRVDKYSPEQVEWVRKLTGISEPKAATLRLYFKSPELGSVEAEGNILVTVGLARITNLITGGGGAAFTAAQAVCGVGSISTASNVADVHLGGDGSSATAYYQLIDSAPTVNNGQISVVSTFGTGVANFSWNEWCWAIATGTITAGSTLSAVGTSPVMLNHKVTPLGAKSAGSAWALNTSVVIA